MLYFIAGGLQTSTTYPLKTTIKYQYFTCDNMLTSFINLKNNKDTSRFYRGILASCLKSCLGRMGETSVYTYFNNKENLSHSEKTSLIALTSTGWKSLLIPLDTMGNMYQVRRKLGKEIIKNKIKNEGLIRTFYSGGTLYLSNMFIGSYIWFNFYMIFNNNLPKIKNDDLRNASIGFSCTLISDLNLNPIKIVKTYKQSSTKYITYIDIFKEIVQSKGIGNYLGREMGTRLLLNCLNSSIYVVLWKRFEKIFKSSDY